jgi:signal transduction histidine kinase
VHKGDAGHVEVMTSGAGWRPRARSWRAAIVALKRRVNPRLHFAAAIGWAVFVVVTLAALIAANLAAAEAEQQARADAEGLLAEFATQVRDALSLNIEARHSLLQAAASQISASNDRSPEAVRRTLLAVQRQYPEFAWLAVADGRGRLIGDTADGLAGADVSAAPWFQRGGNGLYVSDLNALPPVATAGRTSEHGARSRAVDIAIPLEPTGGPRAGVMAAQVSWDWIEGRLAKMQLALSKRRRVEIMFASRDATVLVGPTVWLGRSLAAEPDLSEGGAYVVGSRTQLLLADGLGLGWTAMVRQHADEAFAPVRIARRTAFLIVFVAGLLAAAAAVQVTRVLTRRLSALAAEAEAVRRGQQRTLATPPGIDEVSRIGATLAEAVDHLQTEKQALQKLNTELDSRVAERTLRIERMAEEGRHAAVTRERLRIARDLHDTLAHSLMALLTQVRLVRKLQSRMDAAELDAELARAEAVAVTGVAEARAAINQMRDNGVRDTGLGPALQDLSRRFGQRTGVAVTIEADPRAASWADDRSETVFRIVEEALRNVQRHAQAKSVRILLSCAPVSPAAGLGSRLQAAVNARIEVVDDGLGFDPSVARPGHYGLRGMQEQASLIQARLAVHSQAGEGARVILDFEI